MRVLACAVLVASACRSLPDERWEEPGPSASEASDASERPNFAARRQQAAAWFNEQPRTVARVTKAFEALLVALEQGNREYESLWQAARAGVWLAAHVEDESRRAELARQARRAAQTAEDVDPARAEGPYYRALASGLLAEAQPSYGHAAMQEMRDDLLRAAALDPDLDNAGPDRVLGLLYLRAPGPPAGIGSRIRARKHLRAARDRHPEHPEVHLYLGELHATLEDWDAARQSYERVLSLAIPGDAMGEGQGWRKMAREALAALPPAPSD